MIDEWRRGGLRVRDGGDNDEQPTMKGVEEAWCGRKGHWRRRDFDGSSEGLKESWLRVETSE